MIRPSVVPVEEDDVPGDRVLVKASRGMRFDPIAEALKCL